jgi:sRNA-binding regulator protein Hfq
MHEGDAKVAETPENPLKGLREYLKENQMTSVIARENGKGSTWTFSLHDERRVSGRITCNETYEFTLAGPDGSEEKIHKVNVNFFCSESDQVQVLKQVKQADKEKKGSEGPHFSPRYRHHVKNKSLYPLMNRQEVLFFTLLGGEVLRGVIKEFSRFEINLHMKRGVPVIILRHSILDVRDKKNQCFLKKVVEKTGKFW